MTNDSLAMFANNLAYNGTASVIDLLSTQGAKGEPVKFYVQGHSLAGVSALTVSDGPTSSPATLRMTIVVTAAQLNAGPVEIILPSFTQRYVTMALTGGSAGTYTAAIMLEHSQTNK